MVSYKQLLKGSGKTRKNLWYLKGADSALVSDAIEIAKDHVYGGVSSVCLGVFFESAEDDLAEFTARPYFEERKLAIIYGPSTYTNLASYIDLSDNSTFFIIVDYANGEVPNDIHGLLTNNSKARAVDCTSKSEGDLKLLVNSRLNVSDSGLSYLLGKSNGDSEWLLNKVTILERFDVGEVSQKLISLVCNDEGTPNFEESLIQFDKQRCFLYIKDIGSTGIKLRRIIDDAQNLAMLNTVAVEHSKQIRPISDRTGLTKNQIDKYIKYTSYYDGTSSKRSFNLLMRLYDGLVRGDRLSYVALVSGW